MMESLRREGMIHPIVVRKRSDGTYQLVVGGCRLMAAGRLRWEEVICTVRDLTDSEAERMILAENERRSDTSTLDKAYSLGEVVKNMKDRGERVTRDRLAEKLPYAQGTVSYLLKISERVRPEFLRLAGVEHRDAAQLPQAALLRVADEMNLGVQINRLKAELARLEGDVSEPDRSESAGKLPKDRVTAPDLTSPPFQVRIHNDGTCSFRIDSEGVANADEAVKEAARRRIAPFLRAMGFRLSESDA
jgi:ParB/RepB/Spo0J family partition protein